MHFKKNIATFLLLLFLQYSFPKELYHVFVSHTDTEHCVEIKNRLNISNEHHHCALIKADQLLESIEPIQFFIDFSKATFLEPKNLFFSKNKKILSPYLKLYRGRAPPVSFVFV